MIWIGKVSFRHPIAPHRKRGKQTSTDFARSTPPTSLESGASTKDKQKIFLSESDYEAFIEALRTVRQRYPFSLYAYVLMSSHFHLLLEVDRLATARILQSLLTGYVAF